MPDRSVRRIGGPREGQLMKAAEAAKFDVLLTVDRGFEYQQNLENREIAVCFCSTSITVREAQNLEAAVPFGQMSAFENNLVLCQVL